ncbi:hypothetical protein HK407_01g02060 [Ordospora pajunii]|uniref:uncharacterized protein n=1 Tax=Ordospora pajunii TaxID=3039483 RepID=UPI0029528722|nr:uncharacterized protein HK407_01g02060 [Ordospora pajunii]KAH9412311.1 hypothetical protein HK407_01g02060 [Ordospora pajunii]
MSNAEIKQVMPCFCNFLFQVLFFSMNRGNSMALLQKRLNAFFKSNQERIQHSDITIAMGNEACDLDSFISSLVVAYAEDAIHVVNMKKDVFMAKGELMWVCSKFHIDVDDLVFFIKPSLHFSKRARKLGAYFEFGGEKHLVTGKKIKLLLTDHCKPADVFDDCEVELIIDHHALSSYVSPAKRMYIDLDVGSATTLVSRYLGDDLTKKTHCSTLSKRSSSAGNVDQETLCSAFARLLLIPILIDTGYLKRRTSHFDVFEYRKLKAMAGISKKELKCIIKELKCARHNDHEHETSLILQKDFKMFNHKKFVFGGSTVKYSFEDWVDREGKEISGVPPKEIGMALMLQIESFRKSMGLDFFFVATKNKGVRSIIFSSFPFMKSLVSRNGLKAMDYKGLEYYNANKKFTRKILVPEVIDVIDSYAQGMSSNQ